MTAPSASAQPGPDLYQVLGLGPHASCAEISRAYRRLARRHHPDVDASPGAGERFAEITHAYRVLSDPHARARYDASRVRARTPSASSRPGSWLPRTSGSAGSASPQGPFWLGVPSWADVFHLGADLPPPSSREDDVDVELTLEESYHGTTRIVTVTSHDHQESSQVVIPPGVIDGDRIDVPTTHLPGGGACRPVFLRVRLAPDQRYRLDGRDVHVRLPLSPWEAALGVTIGLDTPGGPAPVEVPANTCTGHVLTLPERGIPNPTGPAGNLYAHAHIVVPAELTSLERDLFRRLAAVSTFNPRRGSPEP